MKAIALAIVCVLTLTSTALADAPAYRASWTATGADPQITIAPQTGDMLILFSTSSGHNNSGDAPSATDNQSGTSWTSYNCASTWKQGSKWAPVAGMLRPSLVANNNSMTISVNTQGKNGALVVVAISGITQLGSAIPFSCGNLGGGSTRQVFNTAYCVNCGGVNPIQAGTTPSAGGAAAAQSTSALFVVLASEEATPSVSPPSGWTQRSKVSTTAQGKTVALSLSTIDSGFTGTSITWGSTAVTDGAALGVEIKPLQ